MYLCRWTYSDALCISFKEGANCFYRKKKDALPFPILYEDKELIVIDKPCGLLSEATAKESQKTAYAIVKSI